jgi:peptidoglycan lytic transglycosylase
MLLGSLAGGGCATVSPTERPGSPTSRPVPGQKEGLASWYGARHHGQPTASGEPFDMRHLTAAHRTLPFGTRVRVTNIQNNRSVVVRVTDRGPYWPNRIIDLSHEAARALGMTKGGVVPVRLDVLGAADRDDATVSPGRPEGGP